MDPRLKIELTHDLLARQVEKRLTAEERNRRRARRMLEDGLARHEEEQSKGGSRYLSLEDLTFIEALQDKLGLDDRLLGYLKESRQAVDAEAEAQKAHFEKVERQLRALVSANKKRVIKALKEKNDLITRLRYDDALELLQEAALILEEAASFEVTDLQVRAGEIQEGFLELAFFAFHTGNSVLAWSHLEAAAKLRTADSVERILEIVRDSHGNMDTALLERAVQMLASEEYLQALQTKYFPDMVLVEGGTFWMGEGEKNKVTVSDFEIARVPLTVHQYYLYCLATGIAMPEPPGWDWYGDNPMVKISWYDSVEYCNWLSHYQGHPLALSIDRERKDPNNKSDYDDIKWTVGLKTKSLGFRPPTEAEWEYAAGGGKEGRTPEGHLHHEYAGSNSLDEVAWYFRNSGSRTRPVASHIPEWQKLPNLLGLFHMSGNVSEWCWDWYSDNYPDKPQTNAIGPGYGQERVYRGGSWFDEADRCRVVHRYRWYPSYRDDFIGFRPAYKV